MIAWFKTLFEMVRQFRERKPIQIQALLRYRDGEVTCINIFEIFYQFELPRIVAQEVKPGDFPQCPKMDVFKLKYASIDDKFALYEQIEVAK